MKGVGDSNRARGRLGGQPAGILGGLLRTRPHPAVAQLVECHPLHQEVAGSILGQGTRLSCSLNSQ